jgi:hypothetical protein
MYQHILEQTIYTYFIDTASTSQLCWRMANNGYKCLYLSYEVCYFCKIFKNPIVSTNLTKYQVPNMKFHENSPRNYAVKCAYYGRGGHDTTVRHISQNFINHFPENASTHQLYFYSSVPEISL